MSKKRFRAILVVIGLLFIVGTIVTVKQVAAIRLEQSQMIEVCRDALSNEYGSDRPGYTAYTSGDTIFYSPIKYERTQSSLHSVNVCFDDGTNDMWCEMQWNGSDWVVTGTASTIVGIFP